MWIVDEKIVCGEDSQSKASKQNSVLVYRFYEWLVMPLPRPGPFIMTSARCIPRSTTVRTFLCGCQARIEERDSSTL